MNTKKKYVPSIYADILEVERDREREALGSSLRLQNVDISPPERLSPHTAFLVHLEARRMLRIHAVCFVQRVAFLREANDADKSIVFCKACESCIVLHIQCVSRCIFSHKILFLFLFL
jgi:hypothetical protein